MCLESVLFAARRTLDVDVGGQGKVDRELSFAPSLRRGGDCDRAGCHVPADGHKTAVDSGESGQQRAAQERRRQASVRHIRSQQPRAAHSSARCGARCGAEHGATAMRCCVLLRIA